MTPQQTVLQNDAPLDLRLSDEELRTIEAHITSFIQSIVDDAGATGAVLGISGGIDSTTVAYLAADALGQENVHGLVMPSEVSDPDNMSDAEWVATELGIPHDVIEIQPIAEQIFKAYPEATGDRIATGNVYVRTRAVLNYFVANYEDSIVLGTGNRSEALTGYYTKYGDQAVDCNPIGNLYKQQVRQLAAAIDVPHELVMKTPSAGMWVGQTDEEEMGLSYDTVDAILALHIDGELSTDAVVRQLELTPAEVESVVELYESSAHKRAMPPAPDTVRL